LILAINFVGLVTEGSGGTDLCERCVSMFARNRSNLFLKICDDGETDIGDFFQRFVDETLSSRRLSLSERINKFIFYLAVSKESALRFAENHNADNGSASLLIIDPDPAPSDFVAKISGAIRNELRLYYVSERIENVRRLSEDDILCIMADIILTAVTGGRHTRKPGFYLLKANAFSVDEFKIFDYLVYKRATTPTGLPDDADALNADMIYDKITKMVAECYSPLSQDKFRYLVWDRGFGATFFPPVDRFHEENNEYITKFIELNAFPEMIDKPSAELISDILRKLFIFDIEQLIGEDKLNMYRKLRDATAHALHRAKSETAASNAELYGSINADHTQSANMNLWTYADFLYEYYFKYAINGVKAHLKQRWLEQFMDYCTNRIDNYDILLRKYIEENRPDDGGVTIEGLFIEFDNILKQSGRYNEEFMSKAKSRIENDGQRTYGGSRRPLDQMIFPESFCAFVEVMCEHGKTVFGDELYVIFVKQFERIITGALSEPTFLFIKKYENVRTTFDLGSSAYTSYLMPEINEVENLFPSLREKNTINTIGVNRFSYFEYYDVELSDENIERLSRVI
jgi:hypothetical protein